MIVKSNAEAMDRKHFIMRALDCKNMSQSDYDEEMKLLEPFIERNLAKALVECKKQLKTDIHQIKQIVVHDGDLKRSIAKMLMEFLKEDFTDDEVKGIFRQGYRIMRQM